MDSPTHVACALWSARHPKLAEFLRMSDAELSFYATEPDQIFHDNIISGDPDSRWYHSRKYDDNGQYVAGAVDSMLGAFGISAHDARREGDFARIRRNIALASHYGVDSQTPWHLTSCMAKTHQEGEETLNIRIAEALDGLPLEPVKLSRPGSVAGSVRDYSLETWRLFVPQMRGIKSGRDMKDKKDLSLSILRRAAVWSLTIQLALLDRALGQ